jgi:hypothetical protein
MGRLIHGNGETRLWAVEVPLQEALFAARRVAYHRCELGQLAAPLGQVELREPVKPASNLKLQTHRIVREGAAY